MTTEISAFLWLEKGLHIFTYYMSQRVSALIAAVTTASNAETLKQFILWLNFETYYCKNSSCCGTVLSKL